MPNTGYIHGSDMLVGVMKSGAFKALGHSKTCEIDNSAETKKRATKETSNSGKWSAKAVNALNVNISAEGLSFYDDEMGYSELLSMWEAGEPIVARYAHRGEETTKYREGNFIITNLKESAPADDDVTYSISLENSGQVTTHDVVSLSVSSQVVPQFTKNGGVKHITVVSSSNGWTVANDDATDDWFTVTKDENLVCVECTANNAEGAPARDGSFTVTNGTLTKSVAVSQAANS